MRRLALLTILILGLSVAGCGSKADKASGGSGDKAGAASGKKTGKAAPKPKSGPVDPTIREANIDEDDE